MSPSSILVVATDMNIPMKKEQKCLWHYKCYPWTIHACLKTSHGTFKIHTTTCVDQNSIWTANQLLLIRLSSLPGRSQNLYLLSCVSQVVASLTAHHLGGHNVFLTGLGGMAKEFNCGHPPEGSLRTRQMRILGKFSHRIHYSSVTPISCHIFQRKW
jgi:hypothetical protein